MPMHSTTHDYVRYWLSLGKSRNHLSSNLLRSTEDKLSTHVITLPHNFKYVAVISLPFCLFSAFSLMANITKTSIFCMGKQEDKTNSLLQLICYDHTEWSIESIPIVPSTSSAACCELKWVHVQGSSPQPTPLTTLFSAHMSISHSQWSNGGTSHRNASILAQTLILLVLKGQ